MTTPYAYLKRVIAKMRYPLRGVTIIPSAEGFTLPDPDGEIFRDFLSRNKEVEECPRH
jgi:hypothetical protein